MSLEVQSVTSGYHQNVPIIKDVSINAEKQKITAIIGPNGAGKTTLLQTIYGFVKPWTGKILFEGNDITGLDPSKMAQKGLAYLLQEGSIFSEMTVQENLEIGGWTIQNKKNNLKKRLLSVYEKFPLIDPLKDRMAGQLSGGERRTLEISKSMISNPKALLLDEPTGGLAPILCQNLYREIENLRKEGYTIVLIDQNIKKVVDVSDYVYVLRFGKISRSGPAKDFQKDIESEISSWLK